MVWGIAKLYKPIKKRVRLRLDSDVLVWFKKQGRGYQTRINRVLAKGDDAGEKNLRTSRTERACANGKNCTKRAEIEL